MLYLFLAIVGLALLLIIVPAGWLLAWLLLEAFGVLIYVAYEAVARLLMGPWNE